MQANGCCYGAVGVTSKTSSTKIPRLITNRAHTSPLGARRVLMSHELHLAPMMSMIAGGLALFLFGLELMTASLKAVAGPGLQTALGKLTAGRFRGLLAGAFVTALLNSSTITTVFMVGFVSAGLMTLNQTVPLIMGANVGSTITAQIIAFKPV